MIVYGRNPVREALRGPREVEQVWATKNARRLPWLARSSVAVEVASAEELEQRCQTPSHQGVCAEVGAFNYADPQQLLARPNPLIVALDQVQDPQNLGSICRTAECAGASGVVLPERRSAVVTGAVCKASAGAVEHIAVARVRNLVDFLEEAKRVGLWCYGADADAATSYESVDFSDGAVLAFGSEGRGLRPRVAASCDLLVSLPIVGQIESLGVAAAAAVLTYAARSRAPAA
jgi:23S rRNA (guanosine2251-2'-O)-methyltransferase